MVSVGIARHLSVSCLEFGGLFSLWQFVVSVVVWARSAERRHLPERAGEPSLEAREAAMREYSRPLRRLLRPSESLVGGTIRRA